MAAATADHIGLNPRQPPIEPVQAGLDCCYYAQLALVVAGIALGALASSTFAIGVSCGIVGSLLFYSVVALISHCARIRFIFISSEHNVFLRTCVGPIIEEILFRGIIQPLAEMSFAYTLPAVTVELFGAPVTLAALVAIVATALIFGLAHLFNSHPRTGGQAIHTAVASLALGLLAVRVGLLASIAMHMVHNTANAIIVP